MTTIWISSSRDGAASHVHSSTHHKLAFVLHAALIGPSIMLPVSVKPQARPCLYNFEIKLRDADGPGYARAFLMEIQIVVAKVPSGRDRDHPVSAQVRGKNTGPPVARGKQYQRDFIPVGDYTIEHQRKMFVCGIIPNFLRTCLGRLERLRSESWCTVRLPGTIGKRIHENTV